MSRASLPVETDTELHVFRLYELARLVRGGELYPRWAPDFYHGYGYPIFNYYAPLSYYIGLPIELMPRLDAVDAVKAVFMLGFLTAAIGMYGFVRDNWGRSAGYVAAAVYLYAPYVQYIDPHARGVLPESLSLGVFPLALWSLDRLRRCGGAWNFVVAVLLVTAVILSHNLLALLFFGLLCAWALWHTFLNRTGTANRLVILALMLGLGTAAFFWLPVYLEREAVNLSTLLGIGDHYDFRTHFVSIKELLAFSNRLDWGASEPAFHFNLGVGQWVLGGIGLLLFLVRRVKAGAHVAFFAIALLIFIFLMLPASTFVWERLPFMPFFQFPWRLLGPAAAMLAILAGAGAAAMQTFIKSSWLTAVLVLIPILLGLPLTQPAPWANFGEVNLLRMSLIENSGRWLGTTSTSDYLPVTVDVLPGRQGSVVGGLTEGRPFDRINWATLPEEATIETENVRPLLTRYYLATPRKMRFRLFLFDFPGWTVTVDGERVETELGKPEGFIVVPVPEGEHVIEVRFGTTPARTWAVMLAAVSLALALAVGWRLSGRDSVAPGAHPDFGRSDRMTFGSVFVVTAVFVLLLNPSGWLHYESSGFTVLVAENDTFADFGEQIGLIGYTASAKEARPGEPVDISLYWKAQTDVTINFQVFLHLLRADGTLVAQSDKLNPGEFPTRRWPIDKYVQDRHTLLLPDTLPPGEYDVSTGMWVQTEGWRLPLLDDAGQQIGDNFVLFTLTVEE